MNDPHTNHSSEERNSDTRRQNRSENAKVGTLSSQSESLALEGLLKTIGQDCRKEPLQYLESTQVWQQGE